MIGQLIFFGLAGCLVAAVTVVSRRLLRGCPSFARWLFSYCLAIALGLGGAVLAAKMAAKYWRSDGSLLVPIMAYFGALAIGGRYWDRVRPVSRRGMTSPKCPFNVGDAVRFTPSQRTRGLYQDLERFGLRTDEEAVIREIRDGVYLYFDEGRGGMPWNEFSPVQPGPENND